MRGFVFVMGFAILTSTSAFAQEKRTDGPKSDTKTRTGKKEVPVVVASPVMVGTDHRSMIRRVVRTHRKDIIACQQKHTSQSTWKAEQLLYVTFTIQADGSVSDATFKVKGDALKPFAECASTLIKTWRFPALRSGGLLKVRYPFSARGYPTKGKKTNGKKTKTSHHKK